MSTKLSLREAIERRVPIRGIPRCPSGIPVDITLSLTPPARTVTVAVAELLVRHGLSLKVAHAVVTRLAARETVALTIPIVDDFEPLAAKMAEAGVTARRRQVPERVDVKALRQKLGLTQSEFALRFGLEEATVRNWEQGRNRPDPAARTLLRIIERHPEVVDEALTA